MFFVLGIVCLILGVTIAIFNKQIASFETTNLFLASFSYFNAREKAMAFAAILIFAGLTLLGDFFGLIN
jgi:hypothetical protein